MRDLNLVVSFMLVGDGRSRVRCASRIKLDDGGVLLYDAQGQVVETIQPGSLESFDLQWMPRGCQDAALPASA